MHRRNLRQVGLVGVVAAAAVALAVSSSPAPTLAAGPVPTAATGFTPVTNGQAPCPEGRSRSATVYSQDFESGIPEARYSSGFGRVPGGTSGSYSAKSRLSGTPGSSAHFFLPYTQVPTGASTYLGFTTRGSDSAQGRVGVNSVLTTFSPRPDWRGISVDITAATRDESGWLSTYFEQRASAGTPTVLQVDRAEIYRCRTNETTRIAGSDRFGTAAELARASVPAGVGTVYVAQGYSFADALSATAVAGSTGTGILLVQPNQIPSVTARELQRIAPRRIVVVGGTRAISAEVQRALGAYAPRVDRVGGSNRYETSALVSQHFAPGVPRAYVATGETFPDALSAGALAADRDSPLLLVEQDRIPDAVKAELTRVRPAGVVVVGGPSAVSDRVVQQLAGYAVGDGKDIDRIGGLDRYQVSAHVAREFSAPQISYLATGEDFADAVTGGAIAGRRGGPLVLSKSTGLPSTVREQLTTLREARGVVLGGVNSLSPIVRDQYGQTLP